jgi:hypothetical protein
MAVITWRLDPKAHYDLLKRMGGARVLIAGEFGAGCGGPVRLKRLEAEGTARGDDRGRRVNEVGALFYGQSRLRDIQEEAIQGRVERPVSVLRVALDGLHGGTQATEVGVQPRSLPVSFGNVFRPVALPVWLCHRACLIGRHIGLAR